MSRRTGVLAAFLAAAAGLMIVWPGAGARPSAQAVAKPRSAAPPVAWKLSKTWQSKTIDFGNCSVSGGVTLGKTSATTTSTAGSCRIGQPSFKHTWTVPPEELAEEQKIPIDVSVADAGSTWGTGAGRGYTAVFTGRYADKGTWRDVHLPAMMDYACEQADSGPLFKGDAIGFAATRGKGWSHANEPKIAVAATLMGAAYQCKGGKPASRTITVTAPKLGSVKTFLLIVAGGHGQRGTLVQPGADVTSTSGTHATTYYEYTAEEPKVEVVGHVLGRREGGGGASPASADFDSESPTHPGEYPIAGALVTLLKDDKPIALAVTGNDGAYRIGLDKPIEKVVLHADLQRAKLKDTKTVERVFFHVVEDAADVPIGVATKAFDVPPPPPPPTSPSDPPPKPFTKDLVFGKTSDELTALNAAADRLFDAGLIYRYTEMAWRLVETRIAPSTPEIVPPDSLRVRAFATDDLTVKQDAYGALDKPEMALSISRSTSTKQLRQGTIWHELGHTFHGIMTLHELPALPYNTYHDGYRNPDTCGSYIEGFATFFAALVGSQDVAGSMGGKVDVNIIHRTLGVPGDRPWGYRGEEEELAVAELLWDLYDNEAEELKAEVTGSTLKDLCIELTPPWRSGQTFSRTFTDRVSVGLNRLFPLLATAAPVERLSYGASARGVWDVWQLYSVLKDATIGAGAPAAAAGVGTLSPLDELFAMHGFMADGATDAHPQNLLYDDGEEIGRTANGGLVEYATYDGNGTRSLEFSIKRRFEPKRRTPKPSRTLLAAHVVDGSGRKVSPVDFEVEVRFGPPYEAYSYTYLTRSPAAGRLPIDALDPSIDCTVSFRPVDQRRSPMSQPFRMTGREYWAAAAKVREGVILSHDFVVDAFPAGYETSRSVGVEGAPDPPPRPGDPPKPPPPPKPGLGGGGPVVDTSGPGFATLGLAGLVLLSLGLGGAIVLLRRRQAAPALKIDAVLMVTYADGGRKDFRVTQTETIIGRGDDNPLVLHDAEASSRHAVLTVTPRGFFIRDLGSSNGTWVNGQRVEEAALQAGDEIRLGSTTLTLR